MRIVSEVLKNGGLIEIGDWVGPNKDVIEAREKQESRNEQERRCFQQIGAVVTVERQEVSEGDKGWLGAVIA